MSITISRAKRGGNNFEIISRDFLRDSRLSFKARGIGGWLMSHTDGFTVSVERIAEMNDCGIDLVKTGLRELERFGYLERVRERDNDGRLGSTRYHVTDQPEATDGEPNSGKTTDGKSTLYKESTPKEYHSQGEQQDPSGGQRSAPSGELDLNLPSTAVEILPAIGPADVVGMYVDSFRAATGRDPLPRDKAKIGKEAKRLIADGVRVLELIEAARRLGRTKFTDLATAWREGTMPAVALKPSTTDQRVSAALALAERYREQERREAQ